MGQSAQTLTVAVIADIHGNVDALEAVLAQIRSEDVDEIWCLGDTLDVLDADGARCLDLVEQTCQIYLRGNHEEEFASHSPRCQRMPVEHVSDNGWIGLWHGSPRNPMFEYIFSFEQADLVIAHVKRKYPAMKLILVGHTHVPSVFIKGLPIHDYKVAGPAPAETVMPIWEPMVVCPGSVGQAAHEDGVARWLDLMIEKGEPREIRFRSLRYRPERERSDLIIKS